MFLYRSCDVRKFLLWFEEGSKECVRYRRSFRSFRSFSLTSDMLGLNLIVMPLRDLHTGSKQGRQREDSFFLTASLIIFNKIIVLVARPSCEDRVYLKRLKTFHGVGQTAWFQLCDDAFSCFLKSLGIKLCTSTSLHIQSKPHQMCWFWMFVIKVFLLVS